MTFLIGLSGYARAGKDSVGDILVERHGFEKVAFATPMKRMAEAIDPIVDFYHGNPMAPRPVRLSEVLDAVGWERAKSQPEVRRFLQRLGTEAGRHIFGEDFWVEFALRPFREHPLKRVAVTDVRFRNEADTIKRYGGCVVRVHRAEVSAPNEHVSEHDLEGYPFDYQLYNDGSLADLATGVDALFAHVSGQP